jgi:L-ascorbate metabolism protein UlaG (beta-lactamase superfamily)
LFFVEKGRFVGPFLLAQTILPLLCFPFMKKTENPALEYIHPNFVEIKTPLDHTGRFMNFHTQFEPNFKDVMKWKRATNPFQTEKKMGMTGPEVAENFDWLKGSEDGIVWLGHACFFIRINGINLITDPVFEKLSPFHKRYTSLPFNINELPEIDYILLSHNHRDHLSGKSLKNILKKSKEAKVLTGLKMGALIRSLTGHKDIEEAGWYQVFSTLKNNLSISFLPSQHWAKRGLFDYNEHLWGAFVIQSENTTIYFSGDTGYNTHLKEVGDYFNIDYCIIGIGAYQPEWFMKQNHISPKDALRAAEEMRAKKMIPMHFGCFDLSDEPVMEPIENLIELSRMNKPRVQIEIKKIGEFVPL